MTLSREWLTPSLSQSAAAVPFRRRVLMRLGQPAAVFILLSFLFGFLVMLANPPLRGADESAHFLRAYGTAAGEFIPNTRDEQGRRGIMLPARIDEGFDRFERARYKVWDEGFSYRQVMDEYWRQRQSPPDQRVDGTAFEPYQGSESYTSAAYLPYAGAAWVGRLARLDFVGLLYLMRVFGLVATTAIAAYAIALTPQLKWAFVMIAMLPTALYARASISTDGIVLGCTMVIAAMCLRSAQRLGERPIWEHAAWMTLSILTKPPQAAFVLLEWMRRSFRQWPRYWVAFALIALPGVVLSLYYATAVSGDVGTWRVVQGTERPEEKFGVTVKLLYMAEHPLHFVTSTIATLDKTPEFWRQMIGVLGWSDIRLSAWVYPALSIMLPLTFLTPLPADRSTRWRVAAVAAVSAFAYFVAVFLIFYLVWTPIDEPKVWGVQGRYFIVLLPLAAVVTAALVPRGIDRRIVATLATAGAVLSGVATILAVIRVHWW